MIKSAIELFEIGMDRSVKEFVPNDMSGVPLILNLGCGKKLFEHTVPLDLPEWDADKDPIPFKDGSVDGIYAFHFLEHCAKPIDVLREMHRVMAPGAVASIVVPYYTSQMQAHDLDHKAQFCEETWRTLFSTPYYDKHGGKEAWRFEIGFNMIMGIVERNLALVTQLIRY